MAVAGYTELKSRATTVSWSGECQIPVIGSSRLAADTDSTRGGVLDSRCGYYDEKDAGEITMPRPTVEVGNREVESEKRWV